MTPTVTILKKIYKSGQKLKPVIVYNPHSNLRNAALLDEDNKLVGFGTDSVYFPDGGMSAVHSISSEESALVDGSTYYGYNCRHAHDDVYMLEYTD